MLCTRGDAMLCLAASFNLVGKTDLPRNNNNIVQQSNEKGEWKVMWECR